MAERQEEDQQNTACFCSEEQCIPYTSFGVDAWQQCSLGMPVAFKSGAPPVT